MALQVLNPIPIRSRIWIRGLERVIGKNVMTNEAKKKMGEKAKVITGLENNRCMKDPVKKMSMQGV
jgi:hypothetical protein